MSNLNLVENPYFTFRTNMWKEKYLSEIKDIEKVVLNLRLPENINKTNLSTMAHLVSEEGFSFSQGVVNGNKEADWGHEQSLFAVYIDNSNSEHPIETVDSLVKKYSDKGIDIFLIYRTNDYTEEQKKYCVVIASDEPFSDAEKTKQVINALIKISPQANPFANALTTPILGSTKCYVYRRCVTTPKQNLLQLAENIMQGTQGSSVDIYQHKIIVVDTIMGSGKTSWCIDKVLNGPIMDYHFLYITPYLNEVDRIKTACKYEVVEPLSSENGKLGNIKNLISSGLNIVSTHELFKRFDRWCLQLLKEKKYILILDESLSVVEEYKFTKKDDFQYLKKNGDILVHEDGLVEWVGDTMEETRFDDFKSACINNKIYYNGQANGKSDSLIKLFNPDILLSFEKVFILTYMFTGSLMKYYFSLFNIEYAKASVEKKGDRYRLVEYSDADKKAYQKRIRILDGNIITNIPQNKHLLSKSWSRRYDSNGTICSIKKNLYNVYRNICHAKGKQIMWTCHKAYISKYKGKGYTNQFVACNARATNEFSEATCLMYVLNWFENPMIIRFFSSKGIAVNEDATALAALLQWIWRSNIRVPDSDKIVNIYIPSKRMRTLFYDWLYDVEKSSSEQKSSVA